MARLRVHCFAISIDGYGAGPSQSLENPMGIGGIKLHDWAFATRTFRQMFGQDGVIRAFVKAAVDEIYRGVGNAAQMLDKYLGGKLDPNEDWRDTPAVRAL